MVAGHALGILLIVLVAFIWVAASQLITSIFKDESFDHPYFLTYFNTCGFALWLLGTLCKKSWRAQLVNPGSSVGVSAADAPGMAALSTALSPQPARPLGLRTYTRVALAICPAWMLANYLFNVSLDSTSVASNSMLSTTSNLWTLFFSACFLGDPITPLHVVAVIFALAGSAFVATSDADSSSGHNTWHGDLLALFSACVYGCYSVMLKYCLPDEDSGVSMPLVFGFIGLLVLVTGWPVFFLLQALDVETFELPGGQVLGSLVLNALIGTNLSDVLWAYALQLTSPLTATLGLSLTIPFGMVSDALLRGKRFSTTYFCGALLVLAGFMLSTVAERLWQAIRRGRRAEESGGGATSCDSEYE